MKDKGTKGKRARPIPIMRARLFVGPHGGRIATGVLRKATHWDEVVTKLGSSTCAGTICGTPV